VKLDGELLDLMSAEGSPAARLLGLARRDRKSGSRRVLVVPMSEQEYLAAKGLLRRIGAEVERVPMHPNWSVKDSRESTRRKAG
jgi:hypothetical protein